MASKGVPMRRPPQEGPKSHHRPRKGEKANKKQMACMGAVSSIDPFVRTVDEVFRKDCAQDRPEPVHKHVWAEMTREIDGEPFKAKDLLFCAMFDEVAVRHRGAAQPLVCLMDGERALWEAQRVYFDEVIGVLDLYHVMERLWTAAHCFHRDGSDAAEAFVEGRLRALLEGRVGYVIGGLWQRLTKQKLGGTKWKRLELVIEYLENNREHMRYDEYLAAGLPIGSGVAEGACRHLVKDRMEQTRKRGTVDGAQAMLHVRATYLNDPWDDFIEFRVEQEQTRLYEKVAAERTASYAQSNKTSFFGQGAENNLGSISGSDQQSYTTFRASPQPFEAEGLAGVRFCSFGEQPTRLRIWWGASPHTVNGSIRTVALPVFRGVMSSISPQVSYFSEGCAGGPGAPPLLA